MATPKSTPTSKCSLLHIFTNTHFLSFCSHSNRCEVISHCGFDLHFPMTSDVEHLQIPIGQLCLLWKNVYLEFLCPLKQSDCLIFLLLHCMSSLCILGIKSSSDTWFGNIFSHSVGCLFILFFWCFFFAQKQLLSLTESHLFIFAFIAFAFGVKSKKSLPGLMSGNLLHMFSSRVSGFGSYIHVFNAFWVNFYVWCI